MCIGAYLEGKGASMQDKFFLQNCFLEKIGVYPFFLSPFSGEIFNFYKFLHSTKILLIMTDPTMYSAQNGKKWTFLVFSLYPS